MIYPKLTFVYGNRPRIFLPCIFPVLLPSFTKKQKSKILHPPINSLGGFVKSQKKKKKVYDTGIKTDIKTNGIKQPRNKSTKTIQREKDSLFNKWYEENWTFTCKNIKLDA